MLTNCKTETKPAQNTPEVAEEAAFYVGTYTDKESKGIYKYSLTDDGKLIKIGLVAEAMNPSYLALSPNKKFLLAVNEVSKDTIGFVSSFEIQKDTLIFKNMSSSGGAHPCHISMNKEGYVLASNYSGGSVGLLHLGTSGKLSDLLDLEKHTGMGTTERQKGPHAHSTWFDNSANTTIISVDLGTNELWFSNLDATNKSLKPATTQKLAMADGAGPRHLVFHPNKKIIYVLNELNNTITTVHKSENRDYNIGASINTVPENYTEFSKAADIHISKDGKFLYASNRGHDSIAIFSIEDNGSLTSLGYENTRGKNPRNFSLSPDDNYLIVANQDTNNLVSFKRNSQTGLLSFVTEIKAPTPVCIAF